MTLQELELAIDKHDLGAFREEILRIAQPCYSFITKRATSPVAADHSKVGGRPDLPIGCEWPRNSQGEPLLFLARLVGDDLVNFAPQLAGYHLSFFGEWEHEMMGRVLCVPSTSPTIQYDSPVRPSGWIPPLTECEIEPTIRYSLPNPDDEMESWRYSEAVIRHGSRPNPVWGERCPDTNLGELYSGHFGPYTLQLGTPHRAFGYPLFTQSHPAEVAEQSFTSHWCHGSVSKHDFIQSAQRWIALLSMESDEHAGLSFGDTGNCGFLVTSDDLRELNFARAHFYQDNC